MRIRSRLAVLFFGVTAVLLLLTFILIYYFSVRFEKKDFYSRLTNRAESTVDLLVRIDKVDSTVLKLIDINKTDILEDENISVYNSNYKEIYTSNDSLHFHEYVPDFFQILKSIDSHEIKKMELESTQFIFLLYEYKNQKYYAVASAVNKQGIKYLKNLRIILFSTYFSILFLILLIGWIFAGRVLKPISRVIENVNTITADSLTQRLQEGKNRDEISQLINTFNELLNRVEKAVKTQKLFVSSASHELRNPLTAITSQLEVALIKKRSNEEYEELLHSVLEDIRYLNEMSHKLLQLTKIESSSSEYLQESIRLDDLIWETKSEFQNVFPEYKIKLKMHPLPENESLMTIKGNSVFLKTCFQNILENACKFSNDKTANVELFSENKSIILKIYDHGKGISEEDLPHIFEPFFRGKKASKTKGYGIGLSIAYKIIQLHKANIQVKSEVNSGTVFIIRFTTKNLF